MLDNDTDQFAVELVVLLLREGCSEMGVPFRTVWKRFGLRRARELNVGRARAIQQGWIEKSTDGRSLILTGAGFASATYAVLCVGPS
ncbi:hypothetical protein [Dokdonella soli]|uniref:hypothetical protein n=1 Tax=Dokdonella soli TaxID=529810 RepID=UPI0031D94CC6